MKRICLFLVLVLMSLIAALALAQTPVWDGTVSSAFAGGDGSEENPYLVQTPAELAYLAKEVGEGKNYAEQYIRLEADLDLNALDWMPIGKSPEVAFTGYFDGNGKTIANLKVATSEMYGGLFGVVQAGGTVCNLGLSDNCSVSVQVASAETEAYAGGIAGLNHGTLSRCWSAARVSVSSEYVPTAMLMYCAGGIAGQSYGAIRECWNAGAVEAVQPDNSFMSQTCAGGIVGRQYNMPVTACYNTGNVTSKPWWAGGIVAFNASSVANAYNTGTVASTWSQHGGIAGNAGTVTDAFVLAGSCLAADQTTATSGGVEKSEAELKETGMIALLNANLETPVFKSDASLNDGYPVFVWQGSDGVALTLENTAQGTIKAYFNGEELVSGDKVPVGAKIRLQAVAEENYILKAFTMDGNPLIGSTVVVSADAVLSATFVYSERVQRWDGTVATAYHGGSGTEADPYLIATPSELAYLAAQANADVNQSGQYFKLMENLDLNLLPWTPIGQSQETTFKGHFDGNYKTIAGLSITDPNLEYYGLFGVVNPVEIKNLGIIGASHIEMGQGNGGLIAGINFGTILNCHVDAALVADYHLSNAYGGGIAGKNNGTILNCYVQGRIVAKGYALAGGIAAENLSTGKMECSYVLATVSSEMPTLHGALAGMNAGEISNCFHLEGICVNGDETASKTEADMKRPAFVTDLNQNQLSKPWMADHLGLNNGFPILKWQAGAIFTVHYVQSEYGVIKAFTENGPLADGDKVIWNQRVRLEEAPEADYVIDYYMADGQKFYGLQTTVYDDISLSAAYMPLAGVVRWDGTVAESFGGGSGTASDPYLINTPSELAYLSASQNSGTDYENVYFKLMNHFDMRLSAWQPIGRDAVYAFKGTVNGNGKIIANLNVTAPYAGLFGIVTDACQKIENIGIAGTSLFRSAGESDFAFSGAVAGRSYSVLTDCFVRNVYIQGKSGAGGIVGDNQGKVWNCYNTAYVESDIYAGGIAGNNDDTIAYCYHVGSVVTKNPFQPWANGIAGNNGGKGMVSASYRLKGSSPFAEDHVPALSKESLQSDSIARQLNANQESVHWVKDLPVALNDGFLILKWQDPRTFKITTFGGEHGTISPSAVVSTGESVEVYMTPDEHYHIADVRVDGHSIGAVVYYKFENIMADHTIEAMFAPDEYTITVEVGEHGKVTPGTTSVVYGGHQTFTFVPDPGYQVDSVIVDGVYIGDHRNYTFTAVEAHHMLAVTFAEKTGNEILDSELVEPVYYTRGNVIYIASIPENVEVLKIFDITGRLHYTADVGSGVMAYPVEKPGLYIVGLFGPGILYNAKVMVASGAN